MNIPLANRLKKRLHLETARLQDEVIDLVYSFSEPVLHGGTAVWRCYGGNRFSEGLDFYLPGIGSFAEEFERKISEHGLKLLKLKSTTNLVFAKVSNGSAEVRFEANFVKKTGKVARDFEKVDGISVSVLTLSADDLIAEKMQAYNSRRLIIDIYDVFHLSKYVEKKETINQVAEFSAKPPFPLDERELKGLVYTGLVPSFDQMVEALRRLK